MDYEIIASGSDGNAVVINNNILIDCGVSYAKIKPFSRDLMLALLTHSHSDHFSKKTVSSLARNRPALRFGCGEWLKDKLLACGVDQKQIDVYKFDTTYSYGLFDVIMLALCHNVPQAGYKIHFPNEKMIYATDTNNLNGITAKNYDLYMIEANYVEAEIQQRIKTKLDNGEYVYELQVIKNHLSKEKCDDFIYRNIGANGKYIYMHQHKER